MFAATQHESFLVSRHTHVYFPTSKYHPLMHTCMHVSDSVRQAAGKKPELTSEMRAHGVYTYIHQQAMKTKKNASVGKPDSQEIHSMVVVLMTHGAETTVGHLPRY